MMIRTPRQAVEDILVAIEEIRVILGKRELTKAFKDLIVRRAVERCLQIIAEAARFIPSSITRKYPDVPWQSVKDTGNFLRHEYVNVSAPILMGVVKDHLQALKRACEGIRGELDRQ